MTTGEQLDLISTVTNVSALTHLLNPSGEGGGGTDRLVPYDDLVLNIQIDRMSVDLTTKTLDIEVQTKEINVELGTKTLEIDIEKTTKEINNVCNE